MIAFTLAMVFALVGWSFGLVQVHRYNHRESYTKQLRLMNKELEIHLAQLKTANEPQQRLVDFLQAEIAKLTGKAVEMPNMLQYSLPMVSTQMGEPMPPVVTSPVVEGGKLCRYVWPAEDYTRRFVQNLIPVYDLAGKPVWAEEELAGTSQWEPFTREYAAHDYKGRKVWLTESEYATRATRQENKRRGKR